MPCKASSPACSVRSAVRWRTRSTSRTWIFVKDSVVKAVSSDFMLDSAERRQGGAPFQRALVHNQNDGLTVNFNGEYPGGVTVVGVTEIIPQRQQGQLPPFVPTRVVRGGISDEAQGAKLGGGTTTVTVFLDQELSKLQSQISELSAKIEPCKLSGTRDSETATKIVRLANK